MEREDQNPHYSVKIVLMFYHIFVVLLLLQCVDPQREVVHIVTFVASPQRWALSGLQWRPSIEIALRHVHNRMLLPGIRFNVHYLDARCNASYEPIRAFNYHRDGLVDVFMGELELSAVEIRVIGRRN